MMKWLLLLLMLSLLSFNVWSEEEEFFSSYDDEMGIDQYEDTMLEAWDNQNNPFNFEENYTYRYDKLKTHGALPAIPWSDTYWPSYRGGIAARWSGPYWNHDVAPLHYSTYSKSQLQEFSKKRDEAKYRERLDSLSPAEKWGVYISDYSYSLWQAERNRTKNVVLYPEGRYWEGLCDGWAAASYLFKEPHPVTLTNNDGIKIAFGSSDVKALLTYYMSKYGGRSKFLGKRNNRISHDDIVKQPSLRFDPNFRDVNPGAFHIVLANQLGFMVESFVMDVDPNEQVWNHAIYAYRTQELASNLKPSPSAARGTVKEVRVKTSIDYAVEVGSYWEANKHGSRTKTYTYRLELDKHGNIIGGEWEGQATIDHPDFLWKMKRPVFTGHFAKLEELYKKSAK